MKKLFLNLLLVLLITAGCSDSSDDEMDRKVEVSMQNIDFGTVDSGQTVEKEITITNVGHKAIEVLNLNISDNTSFINFDVTDNCQNGLQPGESCAAKVIFKPSYIEWETVNAYLEIRSYFLYTVRIPLEGFVTNRAHIEANPLTIEFVDVEYGGTVADQRVTVKNFSNKVSMPLDISVLYGGGFSQTNNCSNLNPSGECTIIISFYKTTILGSPSATLLIAESGISLDNAKTIHIPITASYK